MNAEVKAYNKVEDILADKIKSRTPFQIKKKVMYSYGDNLEAFDDKTLRAIARKYRVKLAKVDDTNTIIEELNRRFNYLNNL